MQPSRLDPIMTKVFIPFGEGKVSFQEFVAEHYVVMCMNAAGMTVNLENVLIFSFHSKSL